MKWQRFTESQRRRVVDDQSDKLLQQMAMLCESVKMLGTQMKEGFETERALRKEDYKNLEEKMSARMEEDFKHEQHAGQQIQSERVKGFKNEENARKRVQNELPIMKGELHESQLTWCCMPRPRDDTIVIEMKQLPLEKSTLL